MTAPVFSNRLHPMMAGLVLLALLPWAVINFSMVANADNLWLAEGYLRFARGEGLRESFFEVNPPLSILLYALPAEMSMRLGLPLPHAIFAYTFGMMALFAFMAQRLLASVTFLSGAERMMALAGFIFVSTLMTTGFFGERDHFVSMALTVLLLVQMNLTLYGGQRAAGMYLIAFISALFVLLKPHYLIFPALMLLYRVIKKRNLLTIMRDADFVGLLLAGLLYAALLLFVFPDYVFHIMPAVIDYYGVRKAYDTVTQMTLQYAGGAALMALLAQFTIEPLRTRRFVWFLSGISVLALLPFIVQGLGYAYHLIPATSFLWMALGIILYHGVLKQDARKPRTALVLAVLLCAVGAYAAKSPWRSFIAPDAYRQLPLVQAAKDCGHDDCRVFVFGPSFEISYLISYYADATLASRFPSLFFLPGQLSAGDDAQDPRVAMFRSMVTDDFKRYQPDTVMLASFEIIEGQGVFDFIRYFSVDPAFATLWQNYQHVGYIEAPFDDYLKDMKKTGDGLMRFDIYKRR